MKRIFLKIIKCIGPTQRLEQAWQYPLHSPLGFGRNRQLLQQLKKRCYLLTVRVGGVSCYPVAAAGIARPTPADTAPRIQLDHIDTRKKQKNKQDIKEVTT